MIRGFLSLFLVFAANLVFVADGKEFVRIGVDDGLSQSWIRAIQQDEYGFIWVGTKDGLNKYDGSRFTIYRPESENKRGLENASINDIYIDRDKTMWVCTLSGVYRYDRSRDYFEIVESFGRNFARCMIQTSDGNYWFGTNSGLIGYDAKMQLIAHYVHDPDEPSSLSSDIVHNVFKDSEGSLWVGTEEGVSLLMFEKGAFLHPMDKPGSDGIGMSQVRHFIEDESGTIWVGTNKGVYRYKRHSDKPGDGVFTKMVDGSCMQLLIDTHQNLWIGHGSGKGLEIWPIADIAEGKTPPEHYYSIGHNQRSLSDSSIETMMMDRRGDIWIGTYGNGLNFFSYHNKPFHTVSFLEKDPLLHVSNRINTFCFDGPDLWIGTESSLVRYNRETEEYRAYRHDPNDPTSLGGDGIYAIHKDRRGNLWVGAWNNGLSLYHPETDSFEHFRNDPRDALSLSNNHVFCIFEDRENRLWIGTIGGGLNEFDYENRTFVRYRHDATDPGTLFSPYVYDIDQTPDGLLWISTVWALDSINPETGKITHYSHTGDRLEQNLGDLEVVFVDSLGQLWLGTEIGLVHFNSESNTYRRFTVSDGLPNNAIKAICEDEEGNLWITTNSGLSKFSKGIYLPKNPRFLNFNKSDGLQGDEFVKRSGIVAPDGMIYVGGTSGYTYFDPRKIQQNMVLPEVLITDLYLGDYKVFPDANSSVLKTELYLCDEITLGYKEPEFEFRFTAIDYPRTDAISYAYILEGFEKEWRYADRGNRVSYTSMNAGEYTFRVKSTNDDGRWGNNITSVKVKIRPAWWGTLWFRVTFVTSILLLLGGYYRFRVLYLERSKAILEKRVEKRTRELSEAIHSLEEAKEELSVQNEELIQHRQHLERLVNERTHALQKALDKAKESDRLKSAFIANISHEIRTPLNGIMGFSQLIAMEASEKGEYGDYAARISENSQMLTQLLNDIIDFSILETGELVLHKTWIQGRELFENLSQEFKGIVSVRTRKRVNYLSECSMPRGQEVRFEGDQSRLKQILLNLLSNACKFTTEGYIKFGMAINDTQTELKFWLEDTGIGIDPSEHEAIFGRFYKIVDHSQSYIPGTGLGLSICKCLANTLGYRLEMTSAPGKGSVFEIYIPLTQPMIPATKKASPKPIEGSPDWSGKTILVAEDAENNYLILKSFLKSTGINLVLATDGEETWELFQRMEPPPDLLLLDIKMPKLTGEEVLARIREINPDIPAIAQTAYALSSKVEEILEAGFQYCISKPIKREELLREISKLID